MGCTESKADYMPFVASCRQRRDLIRAAAKYRYALAAAHVSYFRSLKGVGDALQKFVDQELIVVESSPSSPSTKQDNTDEVHLQDDDDDSHLPLSDSSSEDHLHDSGEDDTFQHHHHGRGSEDDVHQHYHNVPRNNHPQGGFNEFEPYSNWVQQAAAAAGHYSNNTNVHYMKKGAPAAHTVIQEPPPEPSYGYSDSYFYSGAGFGHPDNDGFVSNENFRVNQEKEPPPPPSPPKVPAWDFFNPFDEVNKNKFYSSGRNGYGSSFSSPDSAGVREREGIPDLEEETESEVYNKEALKGKKGKFESKMDHSNFNNEGRSLRKLSSTKNNGKLKQVPMFNSKSSPKSVPSWSSDENVKPYKGADNAKKMYTPLVLSPHSEGTPCVVESSSEEIDISIGLMGGSRSPEIFAMETIAKRKGVSLKVGEASRQEGGVGFEAGEASRQEGGVSFEAGEASNQKGDPSKLSSVPPSSPCGTRDLKEAMAEVIDEFQTAAGYGKEVAVMLEFGKIPYQPSFLKAILSRKMKLAKTYFNDVGKDENAEACDLSSTLDILYILEKKLYKEMKKDGKQRMMYSKLCKRLKYLVGVEAEPSKIGAADAFARQLGMELNENVKPMSPIDEISTKINKLRDEELQPRVAALIHGLMRMWKAMFECHQKQLKAVMESKILRLKANTSLQKKTTSRATIELERELRAWCVHFNKWIASQKSYVDSLNGWLLECIRFKPEVTPDGPVPYSPVHLKASPIFVICNDWHQQMNAISEVQVANAMNTFAKTLREFWKKQDEEGRHRRKAEFLSKDYDKKLDKIKKLQLEGQEILGLSMVASDYSGVSRMDDLKEDCDSLWQQLIEKREKHRDAMNSVHEAAWSSLQGGLFPILKALEVFTSEALKAHEQVRLQQPGLGS